MDIPSTSVIRHWVAWGVSQDCPDEFMEHDVERLKQFEAWLTEVKAEAWEEGYTQGNNEMYDGDFPTANPYQGENK